MFQRISSLLQKKFANHALRSQVEAARVIELAKEQLQTHFGADILTMCQPLSVRDGVLSVAVMTSVVAQEIRLREKEILEGINKQVGQPAVTKIQFIH